LGLVISIINES